MKFLSRGIGVLHLWHCRLGHIYEKHISKLHKDGILDSFDFESYETCRSCFLGKMTKTPFTGQGERASDFLNLIHTDVCGPLNTPDRGGFHYFITFTDNFSRSDRGGEYLSLEFDNHLKECEILSQLTPPRTPQWNGVSERRNPTLLDMVRSMMSHDNLPNSLWGHALLTATYTLNPVPSKVVENTPYEIWNGRKPNMRHLKI